MSERDDLVEAHNLTVKGLVDAGFAHLKAGNIDEALNSLEQGVAACESHPAFAKFAQSHCKVVEQLLEGCAHIAGLRDRREAAQRVRSLLGRMRVLNSSGLH